MKKNRNKNLSDEEKIFGKIFTPEYLVESMLDFVGYKGPEILKKHVIDNSCGEGAFLEVVARRYLEEAVKSGMSKDEMIKDMNTYIHGIEIDGTSCERCRTRLDSLCKYDFGIPRATIKWDVQFGDALILSKEFTRKMDYVVGNPPYVRFHNLEDQFETVKCFNFTEKGMIDLYMVFFEIGFSMMKEKTGKMCFVTPSNWLSSKSGKKMREFVYNNRLLRGVCDCGSNQLFDGVCTYVAISKFDMSGKADSVEYYSPEVNPYDIGYFKPTVISYDNLVADGDDDVKFHFDEDNLIIQEFGMMCTSLGWSKRESGEKFTIMVKNGMATLNDPVFIRNKVGEASPHEILCVKASTGEFKWCLFPYNWNHDGTMTPINYDEFTDSEKSRLEAKKDELNKPGKARWYCFGRTQAIGDIAAHRIAVGYILRNIEDIKLYHCKPGTAVYSGLYVLFSGDVNPKEIEDLIKTEEFISYVRSKRHYKTKDYYTFTGPELEQYLYWKLSLMSDGSLPDLRPFIIDSEKNRTNIRKSDIEEIVDESDSSPTEETITENSSTPVVDLPSQPNVDVVVRRRRGRPKKVDLLEVPKETSIVSVYESDEIKKTDLETAEKIENAPKKYKTINYKKIPGIVTPAPKGPKVEIKKFTEIPKDMLTSKVSERITEVLLGGELVFARNNNLDLLVSKIV